MKLRERVTDILIFSIPVLFIVAIIFGLQGRGLVGIYPAMAITGVLTFLGLVEGDTIPTKSFWILVVGFLIVHGGGMTGMIYYYYQFGNTAPDFLMMGMHPSWFYFVVVYWIGSFVYQAGFFNVMKDQWLSQEKWDNFVKEVSDEPVDLEEDDEVIEQNKVMGEV